MAVPSIRSLLTGYREPFKPFWRADLLGSNQCFCRQSRYKPPQIALDSLSCPEGGKMTCIKKAARKHLILLGKMGPDTFIRQEKWFCHAWRG
jgi:hypothetical protein